MAVRATRAPTKGTYRLIAERLRNGNSGRFDRESGKGGQVDGLLATSSNGAQEKKGEEGRKGPALSSVQKTDQVCQQHMDGIRATAPWLVLGQRGRLAPSLRRLHRGGREQAGNAVADGPGAGEGSVARGASDGSVAPTVAQDRAEDAKTALCSNRGPTFGPIDIRMPAVARRVDEIDMYPV